MKSYVRPTLTPMGNVEQLTLGNDKSKGTGTVLDGSGKYKPIAVTVS